jgi:8-oxo-dGTP pyrophosphatase MutT (NUDIX family)
MLHLIPAPLHRQLYRFADWGRRHWWRVRKPVRRSAHVIAFDAAGRVLLVKHSYGPPIWTLPGGGMGRGEDPAAAAAREFREELGCELTGMVALAPSEQQVSGSRDLQHGFAARLAGVPVADRREIVAAELFDPDALPADRGRSLERWVRQAQDALAARSPRPNFD